MPESVLGPLGACCLGMLHLYLSQGMV